MPDRPSYDPVHTTPKWISDREASSALKDILDGVVVERTTDEVKAICWDIRARFREALMGMRNA